MKTLTAFLSADTIVTNVMQGNGQNVRIDGRRRFPKADEPTFFSKWVSRTYAERLFTEHNRSLNRFL